MGDGVCVGAVVEIRPVATCRFVQGVKLEAVGHFLLGVLSLNIPDDNSEVTGKALTLVCDWSPFINEG